MYADFKMVSLKIANYVSSGGITDAFFMQINPFAHKMEKARRE